MSLTTIKHVTSRCGGGKSIVTIQQLHDFILRKGVNHHYIIASKTNKLSKQNYDIFAGRVAHTSSQLKPKLIDTSTEANVLEAIREYMGANTNGVIFISHKALSLADPKLFKGSHLILDEIPADLVKLLMVKFEEKDSGSTWERFIHRVPSNYTGYEKVALNSLITHSDVERYITNIKTGKDNTVTQEVARLLQLLVHGVEVLYATVIDSQGKTMSVFQSVEWLQLKRLAAEIDQLTLLSAQVEQTLFGFVARHVVGLDIKKVNITDQIVLETKHRHRVRIFPLILNGPWSGWLKAKPADEALIDPNNVINTGDSVNAHMQRIVAQKLNPSDYLLIKNEADKTISELETSNVTFISSSAHGINEYRHIHHAAYLASNRPNPLDVKSLTMFAKDNGRDPAELLQNVVTERCYESAYQCIARTSVREAGIIPEFEHLLIVPDVSYAKYIASWFVTGAASIDTSIGCYLKTIEQQRRDAQLRQQTVIAILTQLRLVGAKLSELLKQYGISRATYYRYRNEFEDVLRELGLIK